MKKLLLILFISLGLIGCSSNQMLVGSKVKPMPVVDYVELDRFMGDWYVIPLFQRFLKGMHTIPLKPISVIMMEQLQQPSLSIKVV